MVRRMNRQMTGMSLAAGGIFLVSFESLIIKLAQVNAYTFAMYLGITMCIASNLFLWVKHGYDWGRVWQLYRAYWNPMLLSILLTGVSSLMFVAAIKHTTVANTVFIFSCAPVLAALAALIFIQAKTPPRIFYATGIIFIGLYFILFDQMGGGYWLGDLFALIAVTCFSCLYVVYTKYPKLDRTACIAGGSLLTAILAAGALVVLNLPLEPLDTVSLYAILGMGIFIAPAARVFLGMSTIYITPAEAGLFTVGETILAPIWVWLALGETPSQAALFGGAIILSALIANAYLGLRDSKKDI